MSGHRRPASRSVPESSQGTKREQSETPITAPAHPVPPLQRPVPYNPSSEASQESSLLPSRGTPQRAAKMPIPRLKRNNDDPGAAGSNNAESNKHRVTHACEPCRQRKTKCSGERPVCKHCEDFNILCIYEDGKRDRTRKEYNTMAARVADYEALLQDLGDRVCEADLATIRRVLNKEVHSPSDDPSTAGSSKQRRMAGSAGKRDMVDGVGKEDVVDGIGTEDMVDGVGTDDSGTEFQVPGRQGSTESVDCVKEDLNRTPASRATGFMGKNTDVNWLGQLRERTQHPDYNQDERDDSGFYFGSGPDGMPEGGPKASHLVSESTYHCDDMSLDVPSHIQAYELPPKEIADLLLSCYLESVHPAFPIIGKITFVKQYQWYYNNSPVQPGPLWLAILNLLFAIAARYSCLTRAVWSPRADDEHTYFSRARILGLGADTLWAHGELQRIQVTGLTSFYLMASNQISSGESGSTDASLSASSSVSSRYKSPSYPPTLQSPGGPLEVPNVAPNIGLFFFYIAKLSNISDDILRQLYRPSVLDRSWASVQSTGLKCYERLERWRSALPAIFDFTKSQQDREYARARMCLAFSYYSALMITRRPFLCKLERRIPNESAKAKSMDVANAASCVSAAKAVIDMLPDQPDPAGMYQETPWWNMVHHLMQAVSVIMLELSLGAAHGQISAEELLRAAEKTVRWLQSMAPDDLAASRAWKLSSELLQRVAPGVGGSIDERVLWPGPPSQDVLMELPTLDGLDSSDSYATSSITGEYTAYAPVTTWEPQMFTSYDNYLLGDDPSTGQVPPHQPQRWNF
ncbi:MAG: hypothetical protein Q9192_005576 [Flavoplaca navasiana]